MRAGIVVGALLLAVLTAGCIVSVAPATDSPTPGETELAFTEVAEEVGFSYASVEGGAGNGNDGVYVGNLDGDLRQDIFVIGGDRPALFRSTEDGLQRSDALPNVSALTDPGAGRIQSALWLEDDGDGYDELVLFPRNGTAVYLDNEGGTLVHEEAGFETTYTNPVGVSTADYDGDGCLDLFVAQYGLWFDGSPQGWHGERWDVDNGNPNLLYRGTCGNGFERATDAGVGPDDRGAHWTLATSFVDVNGDGHPDIHAANDYFNDTLYVNDGDGTFTKRTMGAITDRNGMSSEVADLRGDARPEVFITNIFFPEERIVELPAMERRLFSNFLNNRLGKRLQGNNLLVANDSGYNDVGEQVGIAEGGWGWAAVVADLDSDGEQDAFHTTQTVVTFDDDEPVYPLPGVWVQQDGEFYRQDADAIGLEVANGRGVSQIDYDVDGALDLAVATYDEPYRFYRNDAEQGQSLQVLVDAGAGKTAVGAEVYATVDGDTRHFFANGRTDFQSQESPVIHVGTGDESSVDELRIVWPDGTERTLEDVETGQRIRVTPDGIQQRLGYESN